VPTTSAEIITFLLIALCIPGLNTIKATKADALMGSFFYRVILSLIDFCLMICLKPLSFSGLLVFANISFSIGYIASYYDEVTDSSGKPELSDTGSSSGPRKLKDHPLINFI